jgi:hypothetical protein
MRFANTILIVGPGGEDMIRRVAIALMLSALTGAAVSKDIAICGESEGYSYFPNAGLLAQSSPKDAGK